MSKSSSQTSPQTTSNVNQVDRRVGVDGSGNLLLGEGANYRDDSTQISPSISGDDNFAPVFNFASSASQSWLTPQNTAKALQQNPGIRSDLVQMLSANGDTRSPEQWLYDDLQAGDTNTQFIAAVKAAAGGSPAPANSNAGNFGGAAQTGGVVSQGPISAPISSGANSTAVQTGAGGAVIGGSVHAPVVTAPAASAPVTVAGGDIRAPVISAPVAGPVVAPSGTVNAPIVAGNSAPVTINQTSDNAVAALRSSVTAALDSSQEALSSGLSFADKALAQVAKANQAPDERVTADAFKTVALVALGLGAVMLFNGRRAA